MKRRVAPETLVLALICLADLITTVWWLLTNQADEANPLFRKMLDLPGGICIFAAAKVAVCLVALWDGSNMPASIRASSPSS
jgi:hypothetical protein